MKKIKKVKKLPKELEKLAERVAIKVMDRLLKRWSVK